MYIYIGLHRSVAYIRTKPKEARGDWRKPRTVEVDNLHSLPDKIRKLKSRRTKKEGQNTRIGKCKMRTNFKPGYLKEDTTWKTSA
jgi:hypothetical protein